MVRERLAGRPSILSHRDSGSCIASKDVFLSVFGACVATSVGQQHADRSAARWSPALTYASGRRDAL